MKEGEIVKYKNSTDAQISFRVRKIGDLNGWENMVNKHV